MRGAVLASARATAPPHPHWRERIRLKHVSHSTTLELIEGPLRAITLPLQHAVANHQAIDISISAKQCLSDQLKRRVAVIAVLDGHTVECPEMLLTGYRARNRDDGSGCLAGPLRNQCTGNRTARAPPGLGLAFLSLSALPGILDCVRLLDLLTTEFTPDDNAKRIAFIGLGAMGFPMAGHLAKTGHNVTVFNRTLSAPGRGKRSAADR